MATDRTRPSGKGSARIEDAGTPSRAEIQQRITSLYDRAENDSGTFNATRAMNNGSRRTVTSVANSPRRGAGDPSLEAVARQWFDAARNKIGPVTAAVLPSDRMPERPSRPRPQEPAGSDALRELEAAARELSSRRELEAGDRQPPELTGRSFAALPAVPSPRQEEPRALPAVPAQAPAALPPAAPASATAPAAPRSSLRTSKEQIRRKLDTAREVLARGIAQSTAPRPALDARPAAQTWDTGELPAYRTATPNTWDGRTTDTGRLPAVDPTGTGQFPAVDPTGTGQFPAVDPTGTGQFPTVSTTGTGQFAAVSGPGTGQFPVVDPTGTGQFPVVGATGTGQFPAVDPTGTGQFATVSGPSTGQFPAVNPTGTGQFPAANPSGTGQFPAVGAVAGPAAPSAPRPTAASADPGLGAHVGGFPAPETGILAASYGELLAPPTASLPPQQPQTVAPAQGFVLPTPQVPLPTTSYAPATPEVTLPTPEYAPGMPAAAPGYAPTAPQASAPAFAAAAPQVTLPAPGYAPATPQAAAPVTGYAPQAPLPQAAMQGMPGTPAMSAMLAAPSDLTAHATGAVYLGRAEKALAFARAQLGRPCVSGATGPESYDCSSLTQAAWRAAGVTLPRSAVDQARAFASVGLDDLRAGDLVFFHDDLSHTGLCTGDGMMIHAPGPGARIREDSVHSLGEGALRGAVRPA
ncbi:NlpC/P60 family protein [Streptomyces sp. NPDC006172]|uniref:NlpC/P60 family protein n=1 Tax=Streptomyces sp. NPDC006172 TaxID=3154470 RepID=UPI00340042BE